MKWVITHEYIGEPQEVGVSSASGAPDGPSVAFKMFDDDDTLYYRGQADAKRWTSEEGFEPLDFGMMNAGCTSIQYLNPETKKWETL